MRDNCKPTSPYAASIDIQPATRWWATTENGKLVEMTGRDGRFVEQPPRPESSDLSALVMDLCAKLKLSEEAREAIQRHGNETLEELRALRRLDAVLRAEMKDDRRLGSKAVMQALSDINEVRGVVR